MEAERNLICLLDELSANAWPAPVQQQLEGWKLRAGDGVTRRANSVLTTGPIPKYERWFEVIEGFYRRRSLPIKFYLSDAAPPELDGMLDQMGYMKDAPTAVQIADCAEVIAKGGDASRFTIDLFDSLEVRWLDEFLRIEGFAETKRTMYRQIMSAIGPPARFALASSNGEGVGIGMAVSERGWTGLYNIATVPDWRRQGASTEVIRALVEWGISNRDERVYLQVMYDNAPANALYKKLGFRHLYGYHFRVEPV